MKYLKDVVTLNLDSSRCTGCGRCMEVCPHNVFSLLAGKATIADRDACMECGACSRNCAFEAINVTAGVGCAAGIIRGTLKGGSAECCDSGNCC